MKSIRAIIAGSRDFTDYRYLENKLDETLHGLDYEDIEIVSGACKEVDQLGERYAIENGLPIKHFPADWEKDGRGAGFKRNYAMAEYATHCIVFQINNSKGSQHMINIATAKRLELTVFRPDEDTLLVVSSEQGLPQDELFNKTTTNHAISVKNTMTFSRTKIGFDLPGQPKDKDADFYLWRKRMDEVESISKVEYSKAKFFTVPQGVVCLFEATEPPAQAKLNLLQCPYLAILLHSVDYKAKNWDTGNQDTIKPTAGELAYIEFLKTNGWLDVDDLIGEGFFRYIGDPDTLKENTRWCFSATFYDGDPDDFNGINAIAKQIKDGCGAANGNGKTYTPKQTAKERLAEIKPLLRTEMDLIELDDDLLELLKSFKMSVSEYLSLLFK